MASAQDIFDSLMKDPNHYFQGVEAVEQEAKRRVRQHSNNEKALSMAIQNSAVDRLSTFLRKALTDFDQRVLNNAEAIQSDIDRMNAVLKDFQGDDGWGATRPAAIPAHMMTLGDGQQNVYDVATQLIQNNAKYLQQMLTGLTMGLGVRDTFASEPAIADRIEGLLQPTRQGRAIGLHHGIMEAVENFAEHPFVKSENERIQGLRTTGDPDPITNNGGDDDPEPITNTGGDDPDPNPWPEGDTAIDLGYLNDLHYHSHHKRRRDGSLEGVHPMQWRTPSETEWKTKPHFSQGLLKEMLVGGRGNDTNNPTYPPLIYYPEGELPDPSRPDPNTWEWTQAAVDNFLPQVFNSLFSYRYKLGTPGATETTDKIFRTSFVKPYILANAFFRGNGSNYNPEQEPVNNFERGWSGADREGEDERWADEREQHQNAWDSYDWENNVWPEGTEPYLNPTFTRYNQTPSPIRSSPYEDDGAHDLETLNGQWDEAWPKFRAYFPYVEANLAGDFPDHMDLENQELNNLDPERRFFTVKNFDPNIPEDERTFHPLEGFTGKHVEGEALRNMITKLREAYVSMHVPRYANEEVGSPPAEDQVWLDYPTLGNHPEKEPFFNHEDRENWSPEQQHAFNRLMFNKSLIQQYLYGLVGIAANNRKPHWETDIWPATEADNRVDKDWQGDWMAPKSEIFRDYQALPTTDGRDVGWMALPGGAEHMWNEVFLGRHGEDTFFGHSGENQAFMNGYPNFANIPIEGRTDEGGRRLKNWRMSPQGDVIGFRDNWNDASHFAGTFGFKLGQEYHPHPGAHQFVRDSLTEHHPEFFTDPTTGEHTDANWDRAVIAFRNENGLEPNATIRNWALFGNYLHGIPEGTETPRWQTFLETPAQNVTGQEETGDGTGKGQAGTGTGKGTEQPPTGALADEYKNKINELLNKAPHLDETEADYYRKHLERLVQTDRKAFDKIFERDYINANKNRKAPQDTPDTPDLPDAEKQKEEIKNMYIKMHGSEPDEAFMNALGYMDSKKLTTEHKKWVDNLTKHNTKTQEEEKRKQAEHFMGTIHSQIPHKDTLTHKDLLTHFRLLYQAQGKYGGASKEVDAYIAKLLREDHALAQMAGIDLNQVMQEDSDDAANHGNDLGTEAQFMRREEQSSEDAKVQAGHRTAVSEGAEARRNPNYKPHIVGRYSTNGDFLSYYNLQTGEPLDPAELRYDEDKHHIFHGLDSERVKKYLRFKEMMKQREGELHTSHIGDDELEDLRATVHAPDYTTVRDRVDGAISMAGGKLPTAKEIFDKKFGANNKPVRADGTEEFPPVFYRDGYNDPKAGWYHPESESWINPHRYDELMQSMQGRDGQSQQGSGRVVIQGQHYFGRDVNGNHNPKNHIYAFAVPTQAKQQRLRAKHGHHDQSYYVDHTGAVAHVDSDFDTNNKAMRSHTMPQTHNEVIHDWYSQQLQNHMEANPDAFKTPDCRLRYVGIIDPPPVIQNMYLMKATKPFDQNRPPINIWGEAVDAMRDAWQEYGAKRGFGENFQKPKAQTGRATGLGRADDAKAADEGRLSALAGETGISDVGGHIQEAWRQYQKTPIGEKAKPFVDFLREFTRQYHEARHPTSQAVMNPLSRQEQGFTGPAPSVWDQTKERIFSTIDHGSTTLSSLAKIVTGQNTAKNQMSRRQIQNERMGVNVERKLRDMMAQLPAHQEGPAHPLQDSMADRFYVAPGEQQRRNEKHEELKNHFGKWANHFSNARRQALADGNQELADIHQQDNLKYQRLGQQLGQLDPKLPTMWQDTYIPETGETRSGISRLYQEHIGADISAPPRSVSDQDLSQPTETASSGGNPFGSSPYKTTAPTGNIPFGQFSGPPNAPTPKSGSPLGSTPYNTPQPTSI